MTALMDVTVEQVTTLDELVGLVQSIEQSISSMQAARDGALALAGRWAMSVAGDVDEADITLRTVSAELGTALRVSDRTVQRRMLGAELLVENFSMVWAAQCVGQISSGHARVIVDAGAHIEGAAAREAYAARVLEFAVEESPNRVRSIAERIAQQFQARSVEERHQDAREERSVWVSDHPDAMAELHVFGPSVLVHGAFDRLTAQAKTHARVVKTAGADAARIGAMGTCAGGEELASARIGSSFGPAATRAVEQVDAADLRTLHQRRFDMAMGVLLTGAPSGHDTDDGLLAAISAHVRITIPFLALVPGEDKAANERRSARGDEPAREDTPDSVPVSGGAPPVKAPSAELDGHGPIDPHSARLLAGAAPGWDRVFTHPVIGSLLSVDRYRPSEHLRRHLRARDQRCRFPTCGRPAADSDLDHTQDAALGGATEESNLGALCRRHHVLKHHSPWHVEQLDGGMLEWVSPTGRTYIDKPPPQNTVTFTESDYGGDTRQHDGSGHHDGARHHDNSGDDGSGDSADRWAALASVPDTPF